MGSTKKKKSKAPEDTVGGGCDSKMVADKGPLLKLGSVVESQPKKLKKRKRSEDSETIGQNELESMTGILEETDKSHEDTETENNAPDGVRTKGNLVSDSTVPVKKKKSKKHRRDPEASYQNLHSKDSEGEELREQEVSGTGDGEIASSRKNKKGEKSRNNKEVILEGPSDSSNIGRSEAGDEAFTKVEADVLDTSPTRKKKRKKGYRETEEVGYLGGRINSNGSRVPEDAIDANSRNGLEESSVRKKKAKKSRREEGVGEKGYLTTSGKENKGRKDGDVVQSDKGSGKKAAKKTVRFKEPATHWREEYKNDDQKEDEENMSLSGPEDQDLLGVHDEEVDYTQDRGWEKDKERKDFKYGFYTKEEDAKVKAAVYAYIKGKNWGEDEGVEKLFSCRVNSETKGAWVEIAKCLPRPVKQIYARAHILFSDLKTGTWSEEELEKLKEVQALHGRDWKTIEKIMGRSGQICRDKWRVLRLEPILKKGKWNGEEFDRLCKYVRWSLKIKEKLGRQRGHRILRDDINWEPISEKMGRASMSCAKIWYERLASSLVADGSWANGDDRRLLRSLMETGASSEEAVDWDELLDDRDGLTCERRWYQMIRLLAEPHAPFEDKLEQIVRRYAPDLIGIEEDFGMD
ncbi:hypothetical protein R1flu_009803 [Riccia fluitans]|uniref:Uncharacterized protein n=1 Tax=Riccia fluitans TaxID=41844 RepID=A0ABD1Z367_9MARC